MLHLVAKISVNNRDLLVRNNGANNRVESLAILTAAVVHDKKRPVSNGFGNFASQAKRR